jgi:hypothetical protein
MLDVTLYKQLRCHITWEEQCHFWKTHGAPAGYQVCNITYVISQNNKEAWPIKLARDRYPNDPIKNAPRFRSVIMGVYGWGSSDFADRWGSIIELKNVVMRVIPEAADNSVRKTGKCWMPSYAEITLRTPKWWKSGIWSAD